MLKDQAAKIYERNTLNEFALQKTTSTKHEKTNYISLWQK